MMKKPQLNPVFVKTKNVRNFEVMMDALSMAEEGCFGMVHSPAGRGKTRTSQWYAGHHDCIYLRILKIWKTCELDFLLSFCNTVDALPPSRRKGTVFTTLIDKLKENPRPVFIDEVEKTTQNFLDIVRDIADIACIPVIFLGEKELVSFLGQNKRVWGRTFQQLEFKPIELADIIMYAGEAAGLKLSIKVAQMMYEASGGDFRLVKRTLVGLAQAAGANNTTTVSEEMVRIVIKSGFTGR